MTYSIKQVSQKTGLSIYTLRFYDKEGLLPFVVRNRSGYREFTDGDLLLIKTICCLKDTGMKISDIRTYIAAVMRGTPSIEERRTLLQKHREYIVRQQRLLAQNLAQIDDKLAIYSSPDSRRKVALDLTAAIQEKQSLNLANTFENAVLDA
ncbi:MAG: MerR family transcriptional regulator [Bifidobacteriaceae bacterium]|jgi:DNA-binding transcriptional MerR regulator|nr:MerR family transcriptional regulator [Bifidobacteriaceae bacterium]MCI1914332.1 MerR family transcriptional regulator [Bifidobacteriaceae bacterium]